jgi:hypothetical protein
VPASLAAARGLEESFVVLGAGAAAPAGSRGGVPGASPGDAPRAPGGGGGAAAAGASGDSLDEAPSPSGRGGGAAGAAAAAAAAGFDGKLQSLTALFEMASGATGADHPLCLDCAVQLKEEVEAQVGGRVRGGCALDWPAARLAGRGSGGQQGLGKPGTACMAAASLQPLRRRPPPNPALPAPARCAPRGTRWRATTGPSPSWRRSRPARRSR